MPIEVERKARVTDPERINALLARRASAEASTYHDTYYDWPDSRLERDGRELRVRLIETDGVPSRVLLTFKAAMLDRSSTPEFETSVGDVSAADAILTGVGLVHLVAFQKRCVNYTFRADGHDIKATVVQVPELDDETFLEVETIVDDTGQTVAASAAVHSVLRDLGLSDKDHPCAANAPAVHAKDRWMAAYKGSNFGSAATSSGCGGGRSSVNTYRSVFPVVISTRARFAIISMVPTGSGPIATRSPSTHHRSTPWPVPSATTASSAWRFPWMSEINPSFTNAGSHTGAFWRGPTPHLVVPRTPIRCSTIDAHDVARSRELLACRHTCEHGPDEADGRRNRVDVCRSSSGSRDAVLDERSATAS